MVANSLDALGSRGRSRAAAQNLATTCASAQSKVIDAIVTVMVHLLDIGMPGVGHPRGHDAVPRGSTLDSGAVVAEPTLRRGQRRTHGLAAARSAFGDDGLRRSVARVPMRGKVSRPVAVVEASRRAVRAGFYLDGD
jgi:hypothetical protein